MAWLAPVEGNLILVPETFIMQGSISLHPCVDPSIDTSHQVHYRWYIWGCPVTSRLQPGGCLLPTVEPGDFSTLCNLIPFEWWQILLLPKKSYTGTPVTSAPCHYMNQTNSYWFKVYPTNVQWFIGVGHGPCLNAHTTQHTFVYFRFSTRQTIN